MQNDSPSLKDFVSPIPICQSGADLGSVLNLFQHLDCSVLAVSHQNYQGWGLVYSKDLLSTLSRTWLSQDSLSIGYPRQKPEESYVSSFSEDSFQSLIKPATIYQGELVVNKFLDYLEYSSQWECLNQILILDYCGNLLGQLNLAKLTQYLAQTKYRPPKVSQDLLNSIALPCKIETLTGQKVYANQLWQTKISALSKSLARTKAKTNTQIASWWIQQQAEITGQGQGDASVMETLGLDLEYDQNSLLSSGSYFNELASSRLELEQVADQNYVRVPLVFRNWPSQKLSLFWLVFAAEFPTCLNQFTNTATFKEFETKASQKLLAAFTHELKSPLTGIVGLSKILEGQNLGSLNQRQTRYVSLIRDGGQRMMGIVEDFLSLLAMTTEQDLKSELINLELLCQQVYQQSLIKIQSQKHPELKIVDKSLQIEIEPGAGLIRIPRKLFSEVLIHLIQELMAIHSTWQGLELHIDNVDGFKKIVLGIESKEENWDSTHHEAESMVQLGMNLAIAEYLIQMLQGRITFSQEQGKCLLTLQLPILETENSAPETTAVEEQLKLSNNYTILCLYPELNILEQAELDNPQVNLSLKSWSDDLEHVGNNQYRIIEADGLEQAHNLARIWHLDIIVVDGSLIAQPIEYLSLLRKSEYLAALPLITLDTKTTEAANQIKGLKVFPCLVPPENRCLDDLIQVINIATGTWD